MATLSLVGSGKMATALIGGLYKYYDIEVIGIDENSLAKLKKKYPKISTLRYVDGLNIQNKTLLLCVKPNTISKINLSGKAEVLLSILAGTDLATLKKFIDSKHYVRVMPNIAALHKKSASSLYGDAEVKTLAIDIFSKIGTAVWVESEEKIDIATALAGSGPAYLAIAAEALIDAGVKEGLSRQESTLLTKGLFEGFSALLQNEHPAIIKESVMSPAGTTAAAIDTLEKNGLRKNMIEAVHAAYKRAKELKQGS